MPKIIVERPNQQASKSKRFNIYIDTKKVGSIGNNETVAFKVSPRKHEIEIRNNWLNGNKLLDVDMSDNNNRTVRMLSSKSTIFFTIIIGALVGLVYGFIKIYFDVATTWFTELIFILFLIALVIIPFFRRYFWSLKEVIEE